MGVLYIASDVRYSGKTALCIGLARNIASTGKRVAFLKPLREPNGPLTDTSSEVFSQFSEDAVLGNQIGIAGKQLTAKVLESIKTEAIRLTRERDVLLVEGGEKHPQGALQRQNLALISIWR